MLKNYLTIAIRNLSRHKTYSLINIIGLSLGMACVIVMLLYVHHELSFDRQHKKGIYRVVRTVQSRTGLTDAREGTSGPLAALLQTEIPEVRKAVRVWVMDNVWVQRGKTSSIREFCLSDAGILDIFDFQLVQGDRHTALQTPHSIVLTEKMAQTYFPGENPIGKTIHPQGRYFGGVDYTVTGILRNISPNSTLRFDFLTATPLDRGIVRGPWEHWNRGNNWFPIQTFVRLSDDTPPQTVEQKIPTLIEQHLSAENRARTTYRLQPLERIHLYSKRDFDFSTRIPEAVSYGQKTYGDIDQIHLFLSISLFILLLACVNFMNLSTARSTQRAKEVGLRKVLGAHRTQLVRQFWGEAILISGIAFCIALILVALILPFVNQWTGRPLSFSSAGFIPILGSSLCTVLIVGLIAGSYPAIFISAFQPAAVLKGTWHSGTRGVWLRKCLVIFQFAISTTLIVSTYIVNSQLTYLINKDLGFNKDQVILIPIFAIERQTQTAFEGSLTPRYNVVKQEFSQHPGILKTTACHRFGPFGGSGVVVRSPEHAQTEWNMSLIGIDEDFLDFYEIDLLTGRNFVKNSDFDLRSAVLVNETAAKTLGWPDPLGKTLNWNGVKTIIGIVKDFHNGSLREKIGPVFMSMWRAKYNYLSVKVKAENLAEVVPFLEEKWRQFLPNQPFIYHFADDRLDRIYRSEIKMKQIFHAASWLTVFIACLGVWGLASFIIAQRTKEIGLRRVLGASVSQILALFCKDFINWMLVAIGIACPLAYHFMNRWLQDFTYRIDIGPAPFILGSILTLFIATATVGYQTFRAATTNPVHALRNE